MLFLALVFDGYLVSGRLIVMLCFVEVLFVAGSFFACYFVMIGDRCLVVLLFYICLRDCLCLLALRVCVSGFVY